MSIHVNNIITFVDEMQYPVNMVSTAGFATWFKRQLNRRGWTQADFHHRSGIARSTVSTWTTGQRLPDPKGCDVIADVLGVDLDLVLALAGHRPPDTELDPDDPAMHIIALVKRVDWSNPLWVDQATNMLELFIKHGKKEG